MREQLREIIGRRVVEPLAGELSDQGLPDARLRVEMLVAMAIGASLTRASVTLPTLAETPLDELLGVLEPLIAAICARTARTIHGQQLGARTRREPDVIALVALDPKRLPEAGRSIGSAMRGFKDSIASSADDATTSRPSASTPTSASHSAWPISDRCRVDSLGCVSPIAIRGRLRRYRHRLALVAAILALGAMVSLHHSAPSMGHMHDDMGAGAVVELCLGVFAAVGAAVVAIALGVIELGRWRQAILLAPLTIAAARIPAPRGRDGPAVLRLLCVRRC